MRFGLVHRVLLDGLAALGMVSLVTTGEIDRTLSALFLLALSAAFAVPARWQDLPRWRALGSYSPIGMLSLQLVRWVEGANPLLLAIEFAAVLQIARVATRRGAAHDQQIIALSLLHLIAATVLGAGLAYALCFTGFVLLAPPALLLSHLRREVEGNYRQGARDRTGLPVDVPRILRSRRVVGRGFLAFVCCLSLPVFIFTAVIFTTFPRVGLSLLLPQSSHSTRMVGFSDQVDLGRIGTLHSDPTLAARITYPTLPADPPPRVALYLRGTAFDRYDDRSWRRTQNHRDSADPLGNTFRLHGSAKLRPESALIIDLQPIDPPVLFVPEHTVAIELMSSATQLTGRQPALQLGPEDEVRFARQDDRHGNRYRVYTDQSSALTHVQLSPEDRARYLALPPNFSKKISDLARDWASPEFQPEPIAQRIQYRLRHDYTYDLNAPSGGARNPLEDFLFVSRRGHCEYYSTVMALMLRTLGIPTRNVTGFAGATYNRFGGFYAVRQGDAHSWVEVWLDPVGWQRFDPTPAATPLAQTPWSRWVSSLRDLVEATSQSWSRHVERYDLRQQIEIFTHVHRQALSLRGAAKSIFRQSGSVLWLLLVLPVIVLAGIRRTRLRRERIQEPTERRDPRVDRVVRLYRILERNLEHRGIGRPATTPPLTHALAIAALGHPAAPELLELTRRYQEVRFGGAPFDDADAVDFARRVARLRRIPSSGHNRPGHSAH
jgi:protein-glutamine gamma-glutamyltransferase